jgi:hypothetical protein
VTNADLHPTVDAFQALARSSPWRWRTLHLRHRSGSREIEAWLTRPDGVRILDAEGRTVRLNLESQRPDGQPTRPWAPPAPTYRSDGLVGERPSDVEDDGLFWHNYQWVAMLDPVELSHHVDVRNLRTDVVAGRPVWRADLRALAGYEPRCGSNCCELLFSEASWYSDFGGLDDPDPDAPPIPEGKQFPDHYDVALDVQTGIVVRLHPVGGGDHDYLSLENDIVDAG